MANRSFFLGLEICAAPLDGTRFVKKEKQTFESKKSPTGPTGVKVGIIPP